MSDETQEPFISHLIELRSRLIRSIIAVLAVFLCLVNWARDIYSLLAQPMLAALPQGGHMIATDVAGAFFVPMKVTLMLSFLIALPYVLYQAWSFVAPGLYAKERKMTAPLLVASVMLFFCGMSFAFFVVFPTVFTFVNKFAPEGVSVMTDIDKYLTFVLTTFLAFGMTFEVPVIVIVLVKAGIVSIAKLKEVRSYVIVGAFVISAIFTPPDVLSQFLMSIPLCLLYEACIIAASIMVKSQRGSTSESASLTTTDAPK